MWTPKQIDGDGVRDRGHFKVFVQDISDVTQVIRIGLYLRSCLRIIHRDVPVVNVLYRDVSRGVAERTHVAACGIMAYDIFREEVRRGMFDSNTFIAICHFDIMDPVTIARNIETIGFRR